MYISIGNIAILEFTWFPPFSTTVCCEYPDNFFRQINLYLSASHHIVVCDIIFYKS